MACATASTALASTTATALRSSAARPQPCVHVFARPLFRSAGFRSQQLNRANLAKAVNSGCWGPVGVCGPSTSYRRWTSGPDMQRSFDKWAEQASNNMWFPVDVEETAQQYTFVADVPGLGKNDIKVSLPTHRLHRAFLAKCIQFIQCCSATCVTALLSCCEGWHVSLDCFCWS